MTSNPQKLGEGPGADSLSTAWGGTSPANTLTLGFQPPDPGRTKSLLFNHSFVVLCYGRPRTLIQALAHLPDGDAEAQLVGGDGWEWAGLGSPPGAA